MSKSIYLKLSALAVDDANVRKTDVREGLAELKASITAHGLLQPLIVRKQGKKFAVTAGQRRFYALQALQKDGTLAKDYEVHCIETDASAEATEISLAENTMRLQMHPADQFEAFSQLAAKGISLPDIAARFGYAESTVQKLLKLARVSPKIMDAYRAGELNLEQVQAFACTDDHNRQEEVFDDINPEYAEAGEIRDALTPEGDIPATDKRSLYVGIDTYIKAGGKTRNDLFTDSTFLLDAELLDNLATTKLAKSEKKIRGEGWAWVDIAPDLPYETRNRCGRIYEKIVLSPEQQKQYDDLQAEAEQLNDAYYESETDEKPDRLVTVEELIEEIETTASGYVPEEMALAGCFITIDRHGKIEIDRGYIKPEDKPRLIAFQKAQKAEDPAAAEAALAEQPKAEEKGMSASLVEFLTMHRSAALKASLAVSPDIGLAAAVHAIANGIFYKGNRAGSCLHSFASQQYHSLAKETPANDQLDREESLWRDRIPGDASHFWQWCLDQNRDTLIALLTYCTSLTIDAARKKQDKPDSAKFQHADWLAKALKLDMRDYFTPTAENYFSRISKDMIVADLKEATGKDIPPALLKGKKADLAKYAEKAVAKTLWLPAVLRVKDPQSCS